ncbi:MAG: biopolymer transporter ExbD [candidate division KSB1 bacterium]|nr:biopolymer transporter ExbD [candidate division KSB1 bacterium]MDZ7273937.1 biopolymer transporter ExbD [candidate division KSB1 bacterium]MDZ7286093.1 biopolymer transporter ExbD [candidate division KSB1 bacterium]MDZ7299125.1 biopolymer transporter ExbD [candidate division KSB1 bacterium]MDZ7306672.1 biopolymer transporter ExbD [candidate division KSB1 bacterium]
MGGNRLIIRLIDVAFIILFGFIGISGMRTEYLDLPSGSNPQKEPQEFEEVTLRVHTGRFELLQRGHWESSTSLAELEQTLVRLQQTAQQRRRAVLVNLESGTTARMQDLIDVIDICQRHNIAKNLSYAIAQQENR